MAPKIQGAGVGCKSGVTETDETKSNTSSEQKTEQKAANERSSDTYRTGSQPTSGTGTGGELPTKYDLTPPGKTFSISGSLGHDQDEQSWKRFLTGSHQIAGWLVEANQSEQAKRLGEYVDFLSKPALGYGMPRGMVLTKMMHGQACGKDPKLVFGGELAIGNDLFGLGQMGFAGAHGPDDNGFTNDVSLGLWGHDDKQEFSVDARHRMITERGGMRRWDELTLTAEYLRRIEQGNLIWIFGPRGGLALCGDRGGFDLQVAAHKSPFMDGRLPEEGLQNTYEGKNTTAFLLGCSGEGRLVLSRAFSVQAGVDAQLTGKSAASFVKGSIGATAQWPKGLVRPSLNVSLDGGRFATESSQLTMSGGYVTGEWHFMPRLRLAADVGRFSIGWEVRVKEGGNAGRNHGEIFVALNSWPWRRR